MTHAYDVATVADVPQYLRATAEGMTLYVLRSWLVPFESDLMAPVRGLLSEGYELLRETIHEAEPDIPGAMMGKVIESLYIRVKEVKL